MLPAYTQFFSQNETKSFCYELFVKTIDLQLLDIKAKMVSVRTMCTHGTSEGFLHLLNLALPLSPFLFHPRA